MLQVVNVMNITLKLTSDDNRVVNKTFTDVSTALSAVPTADMSILQPVFTVSYNSAYLNANYVYIDLFDRYYKITGKAVTIGEKIVFTCEVDAKTSWYKRTTGNIKNCDITVVRNGGIGQPTKIPDDKLPVIPNVEDVQTTIAENPDFGEQVLGNCYVITTVNGGVIVT